MNLLDIDKKLFFLINHDASNALFDIVMPALTSKGYLLLVPYLLYILWKGWKKQALWGIFIAFCAFLLTDWWTSELKHAVMRVRPCNAIEGVNLLVGCTGSYSMPSNHASNAFAVALPLFYFVRYQIAALWRFYPFILAVFIAFSRVYVGVHYPSDVIAGALFGTAVSILLISFYKYAVSNYKVKPHATLLFTALTIISLFRIYYILHGPLDLSPDEAHYWEWSRRLDLSYYSKGPMIAYLIYIGTSIFGDNVFGIRIMAVVFSALGSFYMFKLANLMHAGIGSVKGQGLSFSSEAIALSSALLLQIIPMFAPFGVIFTIDSPFIFFWILSLYIFWKAIKSSNELLVTSNKKSQSLKSSVSNSSLKFWLFLGISIGLGLLTKYTMAFFYLCALLFLVLSEKRFLLKTIKPYAALLISLAVFSPVIVWNIQHDWVTIRHTAGQAHIGGQWSELQWSGLKDFFEFVGSQIGIITPVLFVMMFYALFKLISKGGSQGTKELLQSKFLFWFSIPVTAFFLIKSLHGKVQPNWAMTGYITGIIAFARYYFSEDRRQKTEDRQKNPVRKRLSNGVLITAIGLAMVVTVISHYPMIINLPLKLDPSSRLRGWKELGTEVSRIYDSISDKGHVLIFSDRYQVSSELAFYVKGHPKTYCINLGRRMNQYDIWPDMPKTQNSKRINGIFVRIGNTDMPLQVADSFERYEKKILQVYDRGRLLREYSIFICYNFKGLKILKPQTY